MKKLLSALALFGFVAFTQAPIADADSVDQYLTEINSTVEVGEYEAEVLAIGLSICVDLLTGSTVRDEFNELIVSGASPDEAQVFVDSAISWLCPTSVGRTLR